MPSKFEPCGLNQLYSLKYGTIPVVRAVGGLDDSVVGLEEDPASADGIKFSEYGVTALESAIRKAVEVYQDTVLFNQLRQNGMAKDFSWERTSEEYMTFYQGLLNPQRQ
jgi:starch synthase